MSEEFEQHVEQVQPETERAPMAAALQLFALGEREIGRVIAGQSEAVAQALITLLCGGHALVEGVPGVAKTLAVKTLSRFLGLDFRRAQGRRT